MRIEALRLFNVRRFADSGVAIEDIGDGVNVLCAANEFGKSTSFEALHALFFQPYSGTPGEVQKLRPYSGGSPIVEADISTGAGRFRITKQYYAGRSARVVDLGSGRLVAQADEAESFIAALVRGGAAGPAGLLWVRQGITGLEKRGGAQEENEKQVRASLLESVQGEVEAVTGGRRMAEIVAATRGALAELVTATGRPKTGGRYAAALDARDQLSNAEAKLRDDVQALRDALDRRAAATKRLAELEKPDDRQERRKAVETAEAKLGAAKAQSETLKAAEAELTLARERRQIADRALKGFRDALAKDQELRERLRQAEEKRGAATGRRKDAVSAIESARAAADAAEAEAQASRALLDRLEKALRARDASERLVALNTRLVEAETARQSLEQAEAEFARARISAKAVDDLQTLETEIVRLRAIEEAARPTVSIAYEAARTGAVTMDGAALADGEERGYARQARLVAPGLGVITLRSNRPGAGDGRLKEAETSRRALLDSMGVADLKAARARQLRAQELDGVAREARSRLSVLAPDGLQTLREEVAAVGAIDPDALEFKADPVEVRDACAAADERWKSARLALREAEPLQTRANEDFVVAERTLASLGGERAQVDAALGAEDKRGERERELCEALDASDRTVEKAEQLVDKLRAAALDLDSVEAALRRARSVEDAANKTMGELREEIAGLNAEIRARSDEAVEETWRETSEALAAATDRADAFAREVAVLQRLVGALEAARSNARDLYLKPVISELKPLLGLLFDDVSISFDDKTLLPDKILRNGQEEEVERLSGGMREQLSVLTRLAFARLLARDGRPAPVILDDALVYSDDDRIERMFDALHRLSRDQQIIVFSCRQRAFAKLGGNVLAARDWRP